MARCYFFRQVMTRSMSELLRLWCMGRQMTLLAMRWATGRLSGRALSSPR